MNSHTPASACPAAVRIFPPPVYLRYLSSFIGIFIDSLYGPA